MNIGDIPSFRIKGKHFLNIFFYFVFSFFIDLNNISSQKIVKILLRIS